MTPVFSRKVGRDIASIAGGLSYARLVRFVFFILLGRAIGPQALGVYAAIVAFIRIVAPLANGGLPHLFVQHLAVHREKPSPLFLTGFLAALVNSLLAAAVGTLGFSLFFRFLLPPGIITLFIFVEVLLASGLELFKGLYQGLERFPLISWVIYFLFPTLRLAVLASLFLLQGPELELARILVLLEPLQFLALVLVFFFTLPRRLFVARLDPGALKRGLPFALSTTSTEIYGNVDKLMLSKLATSFVVGVYTVGFRIVQYLLFPVMSGLTVFYPKFFRRGTRGLGETLRLGLAVLPFSVGYAVLVVLALALVGKWVILWLFGARYAPAVGLMRVLSLTLLVRSVSLVLGDALTGAGYQVKRTAAIFVAVGVNFVLNLVLIPIWGGYGAAWATVFSEVFLLGAFLYLIWRYRHAVPPPPRTS